MLHNVPLDSASPKRVRRSTRLRPIHSDTRCGLLMRGRWYAGVT